MAAPEGSNIRTAMSAAAPDPAMPLFVADDVALDFMNTAYGVGARHVDCLGSDQQVLEWLVRAGLSTQFGLLHCAPKRGALLHAAAELRESARELVERRKADMAADCAVLNRVLAATRSHQQLVWKRGQAPEIKLHRGGTGPEAVLTPVAEAIAKLLVEGDFELVRKCESAECTLWFYDRTKAHHRRWCSMAQCGNRAKVAAFRERHKS